MEDFIFHQGEIPAGYKPCYDNSLFNQERHLRLQSLNGWCSYYISDTRKQQICAVIHFHLDGDTARSTLRSPFGSVEMIPLPNFVLFNFIRFVAESLADKGIRKIQIKNPCGVYQQGYAALLETFLFNLGFHVINAEVSAVIPVTAIPFENNLNAWEKRRLRQACDAGLKFKQLSIGHLSSVYAFIQACRDERGYSLSMTFEELHKAVLSFPERYRLFSVTDHDALAAAAVSIQVKKNILYNFYYAHLKIYNPLSPVVLLMEGIYNHCGQHHIEFLDLGTSAIEGQPNFSLLDFKLRLGAQSFSKLTFEKILS